ncbi:flagellin [Rhizobium johnstonii]|uniref:flagellin N-terminal helical domain-containing protein n=1 Tax=Rhizobium johnstonii TaxID=3019933 RepID=UPI0004849FF1|nr:flagellin [Rhizobium beringeri]WSH26125.1 flagellin [Rhizobium beringeri]WSH78870.1 flagellin [Rhizobium beringeri]
MTSINTNHGAMAALQTLRAVNSGLEKTQQRVSSGLRVAKASDNAAYWSIATTMRSDKKAMGAVSDSIGFAKAVLDTTYEGMDKIKDELVTIRNLMITASSLPPPATDGYSNWTDYQPDAIYDQSQVAKVDAEIYQHWQQINSVVESASFGGVNLLKNDTSEPTLPGAKTEFTTGYVNGQVLTVSIDTKDTTMINYNRTVDNLWNAPGSENMGYVDGVLWSANIIYPITYVDGGGVVQKNENTYTLRNAEVRIAANNLDRNFYYNALIGQMDERIQAVVGGMSVVGSAQKRVGMQDEFNTNMIDNVDKGVGRLVDADMEEESARLAALQTQQQLAVQSLNIANSASQTIMQLFQ